MGEDKPDLVRVVELGGFEEDDEVLLIHRGALYAVHGIVGGIDRENNHLGIHDRVKLLYDAMEIEGNFGFRIKVSGFNPHDPMETYEFLRGYGQLRREAWYAFPGTGAWEAYKIIEKKPEIQPAPEETSLPETPV